MLQLGSTFLRIAAWGIISLGSGGLALWIWIREPGGHTAGSIGLGIVMALLCISAAIRVGTFLGWWSFLYSGQPR